MGGLRLEKDADYLRLDQIYLHADDLTFLHALKILARSGICSLRVLQFVLAAKFQLLGLREAINQAQQGL
jgi:hypothetical protein